MNVDVTTSFLTHLLDGERRLANESVIGWWGGRRVKMGRKKGEDGKEEGWRWESGGVGNWGGEEDVKAESGYRTGREGTGMWKLGEMFSILNGSPTFQTSLSRRHGQRTKIKSINKMSLPFRVTFVQAELVMWSTVPGRSPRTFLICSQLYSNWRRLVKNIGWANQNIGVRRW